jgi:ubiquinone/menaquinone biosynthesis C-methylase UbiE
MKAEVLRAAIVRQFGRPVGGVGWLAGQIMAHRRSNRVRNRRTVELLALQPEDRVLEIGFGPGLAIAECVPRIPRGHLMGVDHSLTMLNQAARRNAAAIAAGRVTLCLGSPEHLPALGRVFDKALAVNVHLFWSDAPAMLTRIAALLKPGGTIALTHQPRLARATDADALRAAERIAGQLRDAGFADLRTVVLPMKPVNAVCVLGRLAQGA